MLRDGVKLETKDVRKHHIDIEEINSNDKDRSNIDSKEKNYIKDDAKHQSEDKNELFCTKSRVTEYNIEEEKNFKSETKVKSTTKYDEKDPIDIRVKNDTKVF